MKLDYEEEMLKNAGAVEETVQTNGWKYITDYIANKTKQITSRYIDEGFKTLDEMQFYRGQILAYKDLLIEVEGLITNLKNWRDEKSKSTSTE